MRRLRTNERKRMAEDELDNYDDEMIEELIDKLKDYLDGISIEEVDASEIYVLVGEWQTELPDPGVWAFDKVQSKEDDAGDAAYEQYREERAFGK